MADKIRGKLKTLNESLDELEQKLEPLLAQSLPETLVGLETLQQAKLQVDIPYVVYDLIFSVCFVSSFTGDIFTDYLEAVYLKTKGIDPKTHPVIGELVCNFLHGITFVFIIYITGPCTTIL